MFLRILKFIVICRIARNPAIMATDGNVLFFWCCWKETNKMDVFFHNGGLLVYSQYILVSMCKIQKNSYFQARSERLIIVHIKEYITEAAIMKEALDDEQNYSSTAAL